VQRLVHPTDFLLHLFEEALCSALKGRQAKRQIVAGSNEAGSRRQISHYRSADTPFRFFPTRRLPFVLKLATIFIGCDSAPLSRHSRHSGTGEAIQYDLTWPCIMEYRGDYGQVGDFCVVAMSFVQCVGLARGDIYREGLSRIRFVGVIGTAVVGYKVSQPRIRAGGIVWWIGEGQDVLV